MSQVEKPKVDIDNMLADVNRNLMRIDYITASRDILEGLYKRMLSLFASIWSHHGIDDFQYNLLCSQIDNLHNRISEKKNKGK